jgi:hypothetical protein
MMARMTVAGLAGLLMTAVLGCGRGDAPPLGNVTGTVTLDGQPLENAVVTFSQTGGASSIGKTDANGRYELYYGRDLKGALLGEHTVMITTSTEVGEDCERTKTPETVPAKYNLASELKATVNAGNNTLDSAFVRRRGPAACGEPVRRVRQPA